MFFGFQNFIHDFADVEPWLLLFAFTNVVQCVALVVAIILLVRHHREERRQVEALQILVTRGIQPEQLIKLASTLDRLSETDVEDLLASRDRLRETGSSSGSSVRSP
jgi:hypothetical protein